ncbi:MAG: universal stress protein [Bacillota bacterium]
MAARFILLGDDFSDDNKKARIRSELLEKLADEMARRMKVELRILYALDIPRTVLNTNEILTLLAEDRMHKLAINAKLDFQAGSPVDLILKEDRKKSGPELIILGSRGNRGLKKAFLGSVSEEVLRHANTPILILGAEAQAQRYKLSANKKLKFLVLTDLTPASGPAEREALKLAKTLKGDIVLAYSIGDQIRRMKNMLYSQRIVSQGIEAMFVQMREEANQSLKRKVQAYQRQGIAVEGLMLRDEKDISRVISQDAEGKYDLVVMGTHSRNKFLKAFLGSTARNMILRSPVPVLIVRSKS